MVHSDVGDLVAQRADAQLGRLVERRADRRVELLALEEELVEFEVAHLLHARQREDADRVLGLADLVARRVVSWHDVPRRRADVDVVVIAVIGWIASVDSLSDVVRHLPSSRIADHARPAVRWYLPKRSIIHSCALGTKKDRVQVAVVAADLDVAPRRA